MKNTPVHHFEIPIAVIERFENSFASFELCENNVLVVRLDDELIFDREKSEIFMDIVKEFGKGKPVPMLFITGSHTASEEASREYFGLPEHAATISYCAVVISSMAQRLIGNFFIRFNKPAMPIRFFNHPQEAWDLLFGKGVKIG